MTWGWLAIALCLASLFASVFTGADPTTGSYAPRMWSNASLSSSGDCRPNENNSVIHHCCADGAVCVHATVPSDSADTAASASPAEAPFVDLSRRSRRSHARIPAG